MTGIRRAVVGLLGLCALVVPSAVQAQTTPSGIAGVVRNAQGQPVANVKVEAASPALIERVRTLTAQLHATALAEHRLREAHPQGLP